ncbi:hypothetical protein PG988_000360 [Apiospora saccharicola]
MSDVRTRRELAAKRAKVMAKATETFNKHLPELTPKDDPEIRNRCTYCEKPGKDLCGGCKSARYCSRECQVKDHPQHKHICKNYAAKFNDAKRPSSDHVVGILFPALELKPKLVWCQQKVVNGKTTVYADEHIGRYRDEFSILSVNQNLKLLGRDNTGHGLVAFLESKEPIMGCPLNKSYTALGVPGHMMPRFGNILMLATRPDSHPEHEGKNVVLDDADMRDYRHALDCLQMHEMNFAAGPADRLATLTEKPDTAPALLIHGDGALARWTTFAGPSQAQRMQHLVTRISVPWLQGVFMAVEQDQAPGPRKVGLECPAVMRNAAARHLCPRSPPYNRVRNTAAGLHVVEGQHLRVLYQHLGSVLLFERSGAVLHPEHVEVLSQFLDSVEHFSSKFGWGHDGIDDDELWVSRTRHGVEEAAKAFKQFWADWKREQEGNGVPVGHLLCPYELRGDVDPGKIMVATMTNKVQRGAALLKNEIDRASK